MGSVGEDRKVRVHVRVRQGWFKVPNVCKAFANNCRDFSSQHVLNFLARRKVPVNIWRPFGKQLQPESFPAFKNTIVRSSVGSGL